MSQISQENTCVEIFFNTFTAPLKSLLIKRHQCRFFPMNFKKLLRAAVLQNNSGGCFRKLPDLIYLARISPISYSSYFKVVTKLCFEEISGEQDLISLELIIEIFYPVKRREIDICCNDCENKHGEKSVSFWTFSGPYFPTFELNTERYGVSLQIMSECGKTQTGKFPNMDFFQAVKKGL